MKLLIMQSSLASRHFLPLRSTYSHQHLELNTFNLYCFLSVRDQVSHLYKTAGKIMVLYTLIFKTLVLITKAILL
jgi:hypothetical protein